MTPEEHQLLTRLAERIRSTPPQQKDTEADQLLQQLVRERPDTVYILAQTVLMQDFALRNAQAQIEQLQRQLSEEQPPSERSSGSFLGGLFGGGGQQQYQPRPSSGSVPSVNPWGTRPSGDYPPPQEQGYSRDGPSGPVMQPSQTSGFLRNAATTAAGVAGGALLFQGINSLFSGHHGSLLGGDFSSMRPAESLSGATGLGTPHESGGETHHDQDSDDLMDADYGDDGDDGDFGGGDYG